jgi:hypothetical protein
MARAPTPPPGVGWEYQPRTRGWLNTATGERLSRRQYDVRYGRLAAQGYRSYEAKARVRRETGVEPGPARGRRIDRLFRTPVYDATAPDGWRIVELNLNKRDASLVGSLWANYDGGSILHPPAEFKRRFDHRVVHDRITGARYELVGDMDILNRWLDSLDDQEQSEFWELLYRRQGRVVA